MLGRKNYSQDEIDRCRTEINCQLDAYRKLAAALSGQADNEVVDAVKEFEPLFCNALAMTLDRHFVHRVRLVTGKDCNPLNEVELLADSIMSNDGELLRSSVIKWNPAQTVLGLEIGDRIQLDVQQVERLADAFFAELESRFL